MDLTPTRDDESSFGLWTVGRRGDGFARVQRLAIEHLLGVRS